jgi:hypothetical protein
MLTTGTKVYAVYSGYRELEIHEAEIVKVTKTVYWLKGRGVCGPGLAFHCKTRWTKDLPPLQSTKVGAIQAYIDGTEKRVAALVQDLGIESERLLRARKLAEEVQSM